MKDNDKALGIALQRWHSSGGDPIYQLGSTLFSDKATVEDTPEWGAIVRKAIKNLRLAAEAEAEAGRRDAARDAHSLARRVTMRFYGMFEENEQ